MKKRNTLIALLCLISTIASFGQYTEYIKDTTINGIQFEKIHYYLVDGDTTSISGILEEPTVVEGIPCMENIAFTADWKLTSFNLSEDFEILGITAPRRTYISYGKKKTVVLFGAPTEYQGFCCQGNFAKWYSTGIFTTLYPDGRLASFYPCTELDIDGIPCMKTPFYNINLHENGRLKECILYKKAEINGKTYKKKTMMVFDDEGNVVSARKDFFWWFR